MPYSEHTANTGLLVLTQKRRNQSFQQNRKCNLTRYATAYCHTITMQHNENHNQHVTKQNYEKVAIPSNKINIGHCIENLLKKLGTYWSVIPTQNHLKIPPFCSFKSPFSIRHPSFIALSKYPGFHDS